MNWGINGVFASWSEEKLEVVFFHRSALSFDISAERSFYFEIDTPYLSNNVIKYVLEKKFFELPKKLPHKVVKG